MACTCGVPNKTNMLENVFHCPGDPETQTWCNPPLLNCNIIGGSGKRKKLYLLRRNGNEIFFKKVTQQDSFQVDHNQLHDPLSL